MKPIFLSIVIPCYNEEENIKRGVLKEIDTFLQKVDFTYEVIVSDDGSTDRSAFLAEAGIKKFPGFLLLTNPHGGKPWPLRYGMEKAQGEYILFTDMDQSTPISELIKLLPYLKEGFEVIIGSRGLVRKSFPIYRKLGAYVFSTLRRVMILPEIVDTQCGFKLFKAKYLKEAFPKLEYFRKKETAKGWKVTSFDVELLHILKKMGCRIKEVVVKWDDRDISTKKGGALGKYFKESREMFSQILRVKVNDLRKLYS